MSIIGIVDYEMGNLRSVYNALAYLGFEARFVRQPHEVAEVRHLILPGVGSYPAAAANLRRQGLGVAIQRHVAESKPLLGICLGMQLLSTCGTEHGGAKGLDIIAGDVVELQPGRGACLPHVGWNSIERRGQHPVLAGVKLGVDFYFVHSFQFRPTDPAHALCATDYHGEFVSVVARGSVMGVQFHPEKSQDYGLKILENFCHWNGTC